MLFNELQNIDKSVASLKENSRHSGWFRSLQEEWDIVSSTKSLKLFWKLLPLTI